MNSSRAATAKESPGRKSGVKGRNLCESLQGRHPHCRPAAQPIETPVLKRPACSESPTQSPSPTPSSSAPTPPPPLPAPEPQFRNTAPPLARSHPIPAPPPQSPAESRAPAGRELSRVLAHSEWSAETLSDRQPT